MKKKRLTLIHTSPLMIPIFNDLCRRLLPDIETVHMVDEGLLKNILREGCLTKPTARRLVSHILSAEQAGTDAILVTCSSLGRAAEIGGELATVPVIRVDEPMAKLAVQIGKRIGVIATLPSTLNPTAELIRRQSPSDVELTEKLCEGAFEAVLSGNPAVHDKIVSEGILELAGRVDVIVLAQASMARVVQTIPPERLTVPVLSSPQPAIEYLASVLK